jgi:hypothetical protein
MCHYILKEKYLSRNEVTTEHTEKKSKKLLGIARVFLPFQISFLIQSFLYADNGEQILLNE